MRIRQFSSEILRFLASSDPEVLCITGKWGVGKTFAWNLYLGEAQKTGRIALDRYAYVSLFGQNSLEDVRYAIFENSVPREHIGRKPDLTTLKTSVDTVAGSWRGWLGVAKYIPKVNDWFVGIAKLGFFNVRKQVICIDDLERAGDKLKPKEVLGLVSFLKEERECKVVLLLNDEAFEEDAGVEFHTQLEKVADTVLQFEPTSTEAADIGIDPATSFAQWLRSDCLGLGVINIRLIKRIERFARRLEEELRDFDRRVLQQAIHSAALFIAAKYQPDEFPPLSFIKGYNLYESMLSKKKGEDNPNANWYALLQQFGWSHTDEFDLAILAAVEQGSVDTKELRAAAKLVDRKLKLQDQDQSFGKAWDAYHDSFDDNREAVLDGLEDALRRCAPSISPMNLDSTIRFLKELGRPEHTKELIEAYISARKDEKLEFWDLSRYPFRGEISDPEVNAAFQSRFQSSADPRDPASVLEEIARNKGWNPEDLSLLASLSADGFYHIFKSRRGDARRFAIYGALMFRGIAGADSQMTQVTQNAQDALIRIGRESPMNARRVKQYGIDLKAGDEDSVQT